jgi:uncharacterized phosphosugar-binding protein
MHQNQPTTAARDLVNEYSGRVQAILNRIVETQMDALETAAGLMAETIEKSGLIYTFGSGHSELVATEFYFRAGGLACCDVIHEKTFGRAERLPGYASVVLDGYPISSRDLMIVISHSGRNPLPVEMAQIAQQRGIKVIGITSLEHSRSVAPRQAGGEHLFEACDVVVDSCCPAGDALIEMKDDIRVGAASTLAGVFIAQTLVCLTSEKLQDHGVRPPIFLSMNLDEGDRHNQTLLDKYYSRVRGL